MLLAAFGGSLPAVLWDGITEGDDGLQVASGIDGWTLGLTTPGQQFAEATPGPLTVAEPQGIDWDFSNVGAPAELEARIK
jgi:hypothetical protein